MEAHFPRKALATQEASLPQVVLFAILNYHRLSQKCIDSGEIQLSEHSLLSVLVLIRARSGWLLQRLCSDFRSVVLIRMLPGAFILPVTALF